MSKTVLYIGGSELQLPGIRQAQAAGLEVFLTDERAAAPGHARVERSRAVSGTDVVALTRLARELQAEGEFVGAYCSNDFGLRAVAAVAAATGTPGNTLTAVECALNKSAATTCWHAAGIDCPEGRTVRSVDELRDAAFEFGLPVIVKPLDSSGSRGVRSIWQESDFASAYQEAESHGREGGQVLVERYVTGHHIDANAFFFEGRFVRGGLLDRYFSDPPAHYPIWGCQPSRLDAAQVDAVYDLVERAARALEIRSGPVKADVIQTKRGPVILELAPRFHGDVSSAHVAPLTSKHGPIANWFRALADPTGWKPPEEEDDPTHAGWMALFPATPGMLQEYRGLDALRRSDCIEEILVLKRPGHRIEHLGDNTSVCAFLFARGRDAHEVESRLRTARNAVEVVVDPNPPSIHPSSPPAMITARTIRGPADLDGLTPEELQDFASDVRRFLLENISKTGGHIGANLGTVELSVALHAAFESPREPILWDTGHQGYTHKIITGRAGLFPTLNSYGGMNRFITREESEHDLIEASHAGTSISVALGIALAKKLQHREEHTVAVIGDGALAEGLAFEGLNHAAVEDTGLVLVINDNGFAISPGFGGLHEALQAGGERARGFFEALGYEYIGPVNGHDIQGLLGAFDQARATEGTPVVHVKTTKGHGWQPADEHPFRQHFSFPFDPETGKPEESSAALNYQDIAARVIGEEMRTDEKIVCVTPSTLYATGLAPVFEEFPERTFDPGMEEQHALTLTVGFALGGLKPVIAYQSTFLQRAFDQLIHDVCFAASPTLILAVRSGFSGYDNPTHHGIYDFAYLRGLPGLTVLYPKDRHETERMVRDNLRNLKSPTLILMPYGPVHAFDEDVLFEPSVTFEAAEVVRTGRDLALITVGNRFGTASEVADKLEARGLGVELINLRRLKPLPEEQLRDLFRRHKRVVTLEEAVLDGGVGSAICTLAADAGATAEFLRIGLPCAFIEPGSHEELGERYGLDASGVLAKIEARWRPWRERAA